MALAFQLAKTFMMKAAAAPTLLALRQSSFPIFQLSRTVTNKQNCEPAKNPRCSRENLSKTPCAKNREPFDRNDIKKPPQVSMWENPECCVDTCQPFPRFDDLYYKPTDKLKRIYEQTWIECPERKVVQKFVCDFEKLIMPPFKRRPRKERPVTACSGAKDCDLMNCLKKRGNLKCVKISLPGCRAGRDPPRCSRMRYKLDCKKPCCPYPSFSECTKAKIKPLRPTECKCHDMVSLCDVIELFKKQSRSR